MKRLDFSIAFFFLACLGLALMMTGLPAIAQDDLSQAILGEWNLEPNNRSTEGSIIFSASGTYELSERHHDGVKVGVKGEYRVDGKASPARIDLCLNKCGAPGSEWTTRFGIIRIPGENTVEIRTSPDANYPSAFSEDKSEEYTMILTRD